MPRNRDERDPLLQAQRPSPNRSYIYTKERLDRINCFDLIYRIKRDVETLCDTPLNTKELESPKLVYLLSPLQDKYNQLDCIALVYWSVYDLTPILVWLKVRFQPARMPHTLPGLADNARGIFLVALSGSAMRDSSSQGI